MSIAASRNNSIDIAKGIGILLVVIGHNWIITHDKALLFRMIYSFHMPLFFILAGVFVKEAQGFASFAGAKADALLKPYIVVLGLLGLVKITTGAAAPVPYFAGVAYGVGGTIAWIQMWFLPNLFAALLLAWVVLRALRGAAKPNALLGFVIAALFAIGAVTINAFTEIPAAGSAPLSAVFGAGAQLQGLPWGLDFLPLSAAFLLLGYALRKQIQLAAFQPLVLLAAALIFVGSHLLSSYVTDLNLRLYGNWLISPLQAITGSYIVLSLSSLIARRPVVARPLAYLGTASLFILIFHAFAQYTVFHKLAKTPAQESYPIALIAYACGLILPIAIFEISKRVQPLAMLLLPKKHRAPRLPANAASAGGTAP